MKQIQQRNDKTEDKMYRNLVLKIYRLVTTHFVLFGLRATFILFTLFAQ